MIDLSMARIQFVQRSFVPPKKQSYFLFGPRGTGKSRLLRSCYRKSHFLDFLDEATQLRFTTHPEALVPIVKALKNGDQLIADEIQKVPGLLSKIHQIMEDDSFPRIQFVLTGSSARKLKTSGVDLLAGRAIVRTLHPFIASELGSRFDLERALEFGLLPVVLGSEDPSATLSSYVALYVKEEVKQEGLVRDIAAFSRFLEAMSFSHAEILNLSNVSRECQVKRSTLDGFLEILEDLLLGYRVPCFKKRNRKSTVSSEKFYYFDAGVFRSLRQMGPLDNKDAVQGLALEGLVLQNLRAWISYRERGEDIYFWRTQAQNEVDFIVYGKELFWAIEVKNSKKINAEMLSGLKSFSEDYPEATCILLYRGKSEERHGSIRCMPVDQFLLDLK